MKKILFLLFLLTILSAQSFSQKWVKVWSDEFNTPGLPDSTKWDYEVGKLRNDELQYYTARRAENARIQDTVLIIEARKENYQGAAYTSASLISKYKGDWKYGKFEIRAKVPGGKGTWPAIWMMPTDSEYGSWPRSGEIDIMEYVGWDISKLYFTTHFEGTNGTGHQSAGTSVLTAQPYNKFITFTLIWSPTKIEWYGDNKLFFTYTKKSDDPKVWPFDKMFYMILNLAYGGSWGGQQGVDDTKLPHKFLIDYVRVYQLQETEGPFSLNVNRSVGGTVEVSPQQNEYLDGTLVTLTAKPDEGFEFDKWLHMGSMNPLQIEASRNWEVFPVFIKKNELITNGDFKNGLDKWGSWSEASVAPVFSTSVIDSVFVANITKPGTANWHIVEQQLNLPLIQGTTYKISFDAWAQIPKSMLIFLSKNHDNYGEYYKDIKNITTTRQRFDWTVKMTYPTDNNCRFGFGIGLFTGKVYIDNVSIEKVAVTEVPVVAMEKENSIDVIPNPTSGVIKIIDHGMTKLPVTIELYDSKGKLISTLCRDRSVTPGVELHLNLRDFNIGSGLYFLSVSNGEKRRTCKVVLN